jgi:hypothetical protein
MGCHLGLAPPGAQPEVTGAAMSYELNIEVSCACVCPGPNQHDVFACMGIRRTERISNNPRENNPNNVEKSKVL